MRTKIEVTDLNLRQWEHIRTKVPTGGREYLSGEARVCTVFEFGSEELHIEMGAVELTVLLFRLESISGETVAIIPDCPPTCGCRS